jgi:hypothetical protein
LAYQKVYKANPTLINMTKTLEELKAETYEALKERQEIVNFAIELINSMVVALVKFGHGSDVEYGYMREKLDKLNTLVEQDIK